MPTADAYALILAGGGGTRLWPSSRRSRPKQLLTLGGSESLIAAAFRRAAAVCGPERTLVITAADQAEGIRQAVPGLPPENLVIEPAARNTAAAVGLGAVTVARRAGDKTVLAVLPSDAFVGNELLFATVLRTAIAAAKAAIVTVGIRPTKPETGFGYLQIGAAVDKNVHEVARFVEKPDADTARKYFDSGDYLWNSGMFFFTAERLFEETRRHLPALGEALDHFRGTETFDTAVQATYPQVPAISIDFGIMEKASGIRVVPGEFGWNDVGSWAALTEIRKTDAGGNVVTGDAIVSDAKNSVVMAEAGAPFVGVIGVENVVVVVTKDAVLVVPKDRAQDVKRIVEALGGAGRHNLL